MKIRFAAVATAATLAIAAASTPASAAVEVGLLKCQVAPSVGYVVASERNMNCWFTPTGGGRTQRYIGRAGRIGLDLGVTNDAVLTWGVFAPTRHVARSALRGTYAGGSAGAALGAGGGGNVLLGGSSNTIALQPFSGESNTGWNVALGVTALHLR
jgi:Protein of unknown function (DUF992)